MRRGAQLDKRRVCRVNFIQAGGIIDMPHFRLALHLLAEPCYPVYRLPAGLLLPLTIDVCPIHAIPVLWDLFSP